MLDSMHQAAKLSDQILDAVVPQIYTGVTELHIATLIASKAKELDCPKQSFQTLVASGPRSAMPHGKPTKRRLKQGDIVFLDFGIKVNGYCSDCTRTFLLGKPTEEQHKIYNIVLKAQLLAIGKVAAGVPVSEVDLAARNYIEKNGYANNFPHSTGHGIRKRVHVKPRVHFKSKETLKTGEVISVEPGIYIKGWGGVRIEDMIQVTETGYKILTQYNKNLTIL